MGILDKIADIEKEISKTQKNKGVLTNQYSFTILLFLQFEQF